jgi:hypothetical protein
MVADKLAVAWRAVTDRHVGAQRQVESQQRHLFLAESGCEVIVLVSLGLEI